MCFPFIVFSCCGARFFVPWDNRNKDVISIFPDWMKHVRVAGPALVEAKAGPALVEAGEPRRTDCGRPWRCHDQTNILFVKELHEPCGGGDIDRLADTVLPLGTEEGIAAFLQHDNCV